MRYTTKTEYGIVALLYMASKPEGSCVATKEMAKAERYSVTYIEKILQKLRAAKIVTSQQGKVGGYVLARKPSEITLKQVIEALEGSTFDYFCKPHKHKGLICMHSALCSISPVWHRTRKVLDELYDSIALADIAGKKMSALRKVG